MKKIIIAIALMFGSVSLLHAQAPTTVTKETKSFSQHVDGCDYT